MFLNNFLLLNFFFNHFSNLMIRYPLLKNIGYMWNFGSVSGVFLFIQIITGIFLAMFYIPDIETAFSSIDYIMHNVMYGWFIRLMHLNSASFFFLFVYIHMLRGIYYKSYQFPRTNTWITGVTIYILLMGTAFLGYVLPWGQMSFWAATVITNLLTVAPIIGDDLVSFIWGGFSINRNTLNRFFCLHYLLPFIITVIVILHIVMLHQTGSNNELKLKLSKTYNVVFTPFFSVKDLFFIFFLFISFFFFISITPELLNHNINYIHANPIVTPVHIVPEWYFLPYYAILRSILQKEVGIIYMFFSIFVLYLLPLIDSKKNRLIIHYSIYKKFFWVFCFNFMFLGYLGSQTVDYPCIELGLLCSFIHFFYILFFIPFLNLFYDNMTNYYNVSNSSPTTFVLVLW